MITYSSLDKTATLTYVSNGVSVTYSFKFPETTDNFSAVEHIDQLTLAVKALGATFTDVAPIEQPEQPAKRTWSAKCDNCGQIANVSFKPRDNKTFLCNECYAKAKTFRGDTRILG